MMKNPLLRDWGRAEIKTAGAYIAVNGRYPFMIGPTPDGGKIAVIRLGGHRQPAETGWQCAAREAHEEANLDIRPLIPAKTYWADGDNGPAGLKEVIWQPHVDQEATPVLVVSARRGEQHLLSLMYLAEADEMPVPSAEVKGLLLLTPDDVHRLCREPLTLETYLNTGGRAILPELLDQDLPLEPFIQLRLLSRILETDFTSGVIEQNHSSMAG